MRLNKHQKSMLNAERRKNLLSGKGRILFRNNTGGDLILPRPTKSGITQVKRGQTFEGDDYYMYMVHETHELRVSRVIESPQPQHLTENTEQNMDDKLITEQPPVVTTEGTVEFVEQKIGTKKKKLNENFPKGKDVQNDILLNENPLDGVDII